MHTNIPFKKLDMENSYEYLYWIRQFIFACDGMNDMLCHAPCVWTTIVVLNIYIYVMLYLLLLVNLSNYKHPFHYIDFGVSSVVQIM